MSPAEELREAARLMRERAEKATPGRWRPSGPNPGAAFPDWYVVSESHGQVTTGLHAEFAETELVLIERDKADAQHIASWHPGAALAVAALLDELAEHAEHASQPALVQDGLEIARAYLGSSSETVVIP